MIALEAIAAARANAELNGSAGRVQFLESELFENVAGSCDLIVIDPPLRYRSTLSKKPVNSSQFSSAVPRSRILRALNQYLRPGGRILLFFGSSGDITYLRYLIKQAGLRGKVLASFGTEKDGFKVKHYTCKLTRGR